MRKLSFIIVMLAMTAIIYSCTESSKTLVEESPKDEVAAGVPILFNCADSYSGTNCSDPVKMESFVYYNGCYLPTFVYMRVCEEGFVFGEVRIDWSQVDWGNENCFKLTRELQFGPTDNRVTWEQWYILFKNNYQGADHPQSITRLIT